MEIASGSRSSQQTVPKCGKLFEHNISRLKREECHTILPQHTIFSSWKVLIGSSDWEDHSKNKERAERYREHNLSKCSSAGLYELGIALSRAHSTKKFVKDQVIPVYLGQADNVRTRLQQYGRKGAHLETGSLKLDPDDFIQQGIQLFSEIFVKGFAVMYRWAPLKSKQEAEKLEAELLTIYDYAWNKGNNGTRRRNDILKKLEEIISKDAKFLGVSSKIRNVYHNEIGAKFDPRKPLLLENGSIVYNNQEDSNVFSRILKLGRSNPRRVTVTFNTNNDCADICGVVLGCSYVCTKPPVEGKKRCDEHKGMKINGLKPKLIAEHKFVCKIGEDPLPVCGFTLENGYVCTRQIVPGRKRCEEHKGKKKKQQSEILKVISEKTVEVGLLCGANIEDGTFCTRQAVIGRKRCEEHKGRKIKHQFVHYPELVSDSISCSSDTLTPENSKFTNMEETICGVSLQDGSFCTKTPVVGRKRCLQHKGMRIYSEGSHSSSTYTYEDMKASCNMCGVGLGDGSICRMVPVRGRKRCEQHKGMRAAFW